MKIALASAKFKNNDVPFNLRQIEDCMLQAKEAGAELVCFGEAFLQGFDALTWYWERDRDVAVTTDSEVFRALERLTAELNTSRATLEKMWGTISELSKKGTRSSRELAMLILSAFSRMSPTIHMFRSTICIRVTGSLPAAMS